MITTWPAEDVAVLRRMWCDGATGTQISKALGERYSRNAVQGKADRLGLANRSHKGGRAVPLKVRVEVTPKVRGRPVVNPRGNKPKPVEYKHKAVGITFPAARGTPETKLKLLQDLARDECRFPTSAHEAREHRFCGHPTAPQRPFCPAHCAIAYSAPKQ